MNGCCTPEKLDRTPNIYSISGTPKSNFDSRSQADTAWVDSQVVAARLQHTTLAATHIQFLARHCRAATLFARMHSETA
jgi:hypothetical protein